MHTALMVLTRYEANDIVANSRKKPLEAWRKLQGSDMIRRQEEENETFCAQSFLMDSTLFWTSKRGSNAGSLTKEKLDDEIKLAGFESVVPEELEKHLIFNSNRLRISRMRARKS